MPKFRRKLIGNRYHVQRRRLCWWQTVYHTRDAMFADNLCERLNKGLPITERRMSQEEINGAGEHRKRFFIVLPQLKSSVFGSTQEMR